ncbi:MAG: DNA polymerase IV [Anaerolineales bacterium]|jgi:DNA polymerase-4
MPRKIIHVDLDAFFCAVEELRDPSLRGKAFAVGGRPESRGVVASCSYAARTYGVRSAMPMARAVKLCRNLIIVSSRHSAYGEVSEQVMASLRDLTALVEPLSIDEAFLDVSDLPDPGEQIARGIQRRIRDELGLPCSLGVATNKLVAKIATDVGKAAARGGNPPNAVTVVPPGGEAQFLAPLPIEALWGVGPKTAAKLHELGVETIGDLARQSERELRARYGAIGHDFWERSRGMDDSPVEVEREVKSVSQEETFARDLRDGDSLRRTLRSQAEAVAGRLRQEERLGSTVRLKLRWPDFTTVSRQCTLPHPTDQDQEIYQAALGLLEKAWRNGRAVRLVGVGVTHLTTAVRQLSLWEADSEKGRRLNAAIDLIRERFGENVIERGSALGPRPPVTGRSSKPS